MKDVMVLFSLTTINAVLTELMTILACCQGFVKYASSNEKLLFLIICAFDMLLKFVNFNPQSCTYCSSECTLSMGIKYN